jgi:hypothetical protein
MFDFGGVRLAAGVVANAEQSAPLHCWQLNGPLSLCIAFKVWAIHQYRIGHRPIVLGGCPAAPAARRDQAEVVSNCSFKRAVPRSPQLGQLRPRRR